MTVLYRWISVYDEVSKYIVSATGSSVRRPFHLAAIHTQHEVGEEDRSKRHDEYAGEVGSIYFDWK